MIYGKITYSVSYIQNSTMKKIAMLVIVATLVGACSNKEAKESYKVSESTAAAGMADEQTLSYEEKSPPSTLPAPERLELKIPAKIIKNAQVQFQVKQLEESHTRILALLKKNNAYMGSDNRSTSGYQIQSDIIIRVPSENFDALLKEVMTESIYTNSANSSAEDVTAQFVDIEARLKTKKNVEQRYSDLLREAKKIQDILDIEEKLRVIREEIESAEGQLRLLKDQVSYSTISLNLYQKLDYQPEPDMGFISHVSEAFVKGWRSMTDLLIGIVRVWPFVLIWIGILFVIYKKFWSKK